jgi:hypothetical protein
MCETKLDIIKQAAKASLKGRKPRYRPYSAQTYLFGGAYGPSMSELYSKGRKGC